MVCSVIAPHHGAGDLDRESAREALRRSLQGILACGFGSVGWWVRVRVFLALDSELQGALAACSANYLVFGTGAVDSDLAGADVGFAVAEDEGLGAIC